MLGGICLSMVCEIDVICVVVVWMLMFGWKKILMILKLWNDCDLMCVMLLIVVLSVCL